MKRFLLDSNIIIYHLSDAPEIHQFFSSVNALTDKIFYSFVSGIELLGYHNLTSKEKSEIASLLDTFSKVSLNDDIEATTIEIRQKKRIRIPDAIIAASAIYTGSVLVTRNEKDFKGISDLDILNPFRQLEKSRKRKSKS